ncbi:hypothetical protein TcasGA2_TC011775 [Tribolium castaneum]|uniref:Uncharacterized protein n=1 Tax=Tribolium castaneum TaxID=7070 RepID=D6WZT6_TRICA|nr:hypothetical protein TcasGA2_TC011775 [Tribolium castaneum]
MMVRLNFLSSKEEIDDLPLFLTHREKLKNRPQLRPREEDSYKLRRPMYFYLHAVAKSRPFSKSTARNRKGATLQAALRRDLEGYKNPVLLEARTNALLSRLRVKQPNSGPGKIRAPGPVRGHFSSMRFGEGRDEGKYKQAPASSSQENRPPSGVIGVLIVAGVSAVSHVERRRGGGENERDVPTPWLENGAVGITTVPEMGRHRLEKDPFKHIIKLKADYLPPLRYLEVYLVPLGLPVPFPSLIKVVVSRAVNPGVLNPWPHIVKNRQLPPCPDVTVRNGRICVRAVSPTPSRGNTTPMKTVFPSSSLWLFSLHFDMARATYRAITDNRNNYTLYAFSIQKLPVIDQLFLNKIYKLHFQYAAQAVRHELRFPCNNETFCADLKAAADRKNRAVSARTGSSSSPSAIYNKETLKTKKSFTHDPIPSADNKHGVNRGGDNDNEAIF